MPEMPSFCLMAKASGSMKSAKSNGDNGYPCLVALFRVNDLDICPSVITNAEGVLYRILIELMKWEPKPKWFKEMKKKGQPTLPNTFSASRVKVMAGYLMSISVLVLYR